VSQLSVKYGSLNDSQHYGPPGPITGIALPFKHTLLGPCTLVHLTSLIQLSFAAYGYSLKKLKLNLNSGGWNKGPLDTVAT
jgi:hypothetical protein